MNYNLYSSNIIKNAGGQYVSSPRIGNLYTYEYHPKYYKLLPFYDIAPLVIIIDFTPDGWYGMNTHYLPIVEREYMIKELEDTLESSKNDRKIASDLSRAISKRFSLRKYWSFAFKRYIASYVQSNIIYIPPENWYYALNVQVKSFTKIKTDKVPEKFKKYKAMA